MKLLEDWKVRRGTRSWAQCGEDLIAAFYFHNLKVPDIRYLDIGAHHPYLFSNTYLFHRRGMRGVLVEPSAEACRALRSGRRGDTVLRAAVVPKPAASVTLRKLSASTLNTVSEADADAAVAHGRYGKQVLTGTEEVPALTVGQVLEEHCGRCPDLVSLDIEGMDLPVLRTWDFKRWRPKLFIVETLRFSKDGKRLDKVKGIDQVFLRAGYSVYADTFINTLYSSADPKRVPAHG